MTSKYVSLKDIFILMKIFLDAVTLDQLATPIASYKIFHDVTYVFKKYFHSYANDVRTGVLYYTESAAATLDQLAAHLVSKTYFMIRNICFCLILIFFSFTLALRDRV